MIIWESENIAKCQICGISSSPYPSRFEGMTGTAIIYRLTACGHLLDPASNQQIQRTQKAVPLI